MNFLKNEVINKRVAGMHNLKYENAQFKNKYLKDIKYNVNLEIIAHIRGNIEVMQTAYVI